MVLLGLCICVSEGVTSLREVFGKVRRDRLIVPWEVYEASDFFFLFFFLSMFCSLSDLNDLSLYLALMEYYCSYDRAVASRIFERGLDYFGSEEINNIMFLAISVS